MQYITPGTKYLSRVQATETFINKSREAMGDCFFIICLLDAIDISYIITSRQRVIELKHTLSMYV